MPSAWTALAVGSLYIPYITRDGWSVAQAWYWRLVNRERQAYGVAFIVWLSVLWNFAAIDWCAQNYFVWVWTRGCDVFHVASLRKTVTASPPIVRITSPVFQHLKFIYFLKDTSVASVQNSEVVEALYSYEIWYRLRYPKANSGNMRLKFSWEDFHRFFIPDFFLFFILIVLLSL